MCQHTIGVDCLIHHKFCSLCGYNFIVPFRCFLFVFSSFSHVDGLILFQLGLFHDPFQFIFTKGFITLGVFITHLLNMLQTVVVFFLPLLFFFQFLSEPGLLVVDPALFCLPCGILRRQTVPFFLLPRVFRGTLCTLFLLVVLEPLGGRLNILR